jgi:hypothetical protein
MIDIRSTAARIFRRRRPQPTSDRLMYDIGVVDSVVALASIMTAAGVITREQLAQTYAVAVDQQRAQGAGDPRMLACRTIQAFFAAPLPGDRSQIRLIVNNTPSAPR